MGQNVIVTGSGWADPWGWVIANNGLHRSSGRTRHHRQAERRTGIRNGSTWGLGNRVNVHPGHFNNGVHRRGITITRPVISRNHSGCRSANERGQPTPASCHWKPNVNHRLLVGPSPSVQRIPGWVGSSPGNGYWLGSRYG